MKNCDICEKELIIRDRGFDGQIVECINCQTAYWRLNGILTCIFPEHFISEAKKYWQEKKESPSPTIGNEFPNLNKQFEQQRVNEWISANVQAESKEAVEAVSLN